MIVWPYCILPIPFSRRRTPIHAERQRRSSIVSVLGRTSSLHLIRPSSKSIIGSLFLQFEDHNMIIRVQRWESKFRCKVKVMESLRARVGTIGSDKIEFFPSCVRRRGRTLRVNAATWLRKAAQCVCFMNCVHVFSPMEKEQFSGVIVVLCTLAVESNAFALGHK
ncbi:hypothetical protein V8G54_005482, partial [Vigna mungo]